jgi:hypothetical protein
MGEKEMPHFSQEKWVDYARSVVREDEKSLMRSHLEAGCMKCSRELNLWRRLYQFAKSESEYKPSEKVVRILTAAFPARRPLRETNLMPQIANLLFDSLSFPAAAGMRSSVSPSRKILYGAGSYRIDIRIEPQVDTEKIVLVGQILNSADPEECLSEVPVTLLKGKKVLAESVTSRHGEFRIEFDLEGSFHARFTLPEGTGITLPLIEPIFAQGDGSLQMIEPNQLRTNSRAGKKNGKATDSLRHYRH